MQIHRASQAARSRQACSPLSPDLRKKYGRRSVRVVEGDSVDVSRGEYRNVQGKVASVDVRSGTVTLEGVQGEKQRGDRFDVKIHASNLRVTAINGRDKKRMKRLTGTESALPAAGQEEARPDAAPPADEAPLAGRDDAPDDARPGAAPPAGEAPPAGRDDAPDDARPDAAPQADDAPAAGQDDARPDDAPPAGQGARDKGDAPGRAEDER